MGMKSSSKRQIYVADSRTYLIGNIEGFQLLKPLEVEVFEREAGVDEGIIASHRLPTGIREWSDGLLLIGDGKTTEDAIRSLSIMLVDRYNETEERVKDLPDPLSNIEYRYLTSVMKRIYH